MYSLSMRRSGRPSLLTSAISTPRAVPGIGITVEAMKSGFARRYGGYRGGAEREWGAIVDGILKSYGAGDWTRTEGGDLSGEIEAACDGGSCDGAGDSGAEALDREGLRG
jgi:hypothetical protein